MTEPNLLRDLLIVFAAALPIVALFHRWQFPSLVGFILAGTLIGPHGLGLIARTDAVDAIAELGLILLLFVVGLELSLSQLVQFGRSLLLLGIAQISVTTAITALAAHGLGLPWQTSWVSGLIISNSSTAIVLKVLGDRKETDSLPGRIALGVLLVQDLALLPMVFVTRTLANVEVASWLTLVHVLAQSLIGLAVIVGSARVIFPWLLYRVVQVRSREVFTGTIVFLTLGTAWLAAQLGLTLALGAFVAGLVISESEYSHAVVADVLPFRDTLNSIFFISVGMLVPLARLWNSPLGFLGVATSVMVLKTVIAYAAVFWVFRSARTAATVAMALSSMSELGFVLIEVARSGQLISTEMYENFCGLAVLTMLPLPSLMAALPAAWDRFAPWMGRLEERPAESVHEAPTAVTIVGYGLNGENLARVLQATGLPLVVVELDPRRVRLARERELPVLFGDATRPAVLRSAGVERAQVVVIAISDALATRRIVAHVRALNPTVPLIVRTRYVAEIEQLQRLGATEVIPEEFETSVEIFARVLQRLRVPRNIINAQIDLVRREGYRMLRGLDLPRQTLDQLKEILAATTTETFLVTRDSRLCGKSLRDLRLRKEAGATVIAIVRGGKPILNPAPDEQFQGGDILVLVGSHEQLDRALDVLEQLQGTRE